MNDDLGRGQLNWPAERWQELEKIASDALNEHVILRNLVDHREIAPDVFSVRSAGQNVNVATIVSPQFQFNMEQEDGADLERRVRLAAQQLAALEDRAVLATMPNQNPQPFAVLNYQAFSAAKNALRNAGVLNGLGVVVAIGVLTTLETQVVGVKSGAEAVEQLLSTKVNDTSALPLNQVDALVFQASPPAFRIDRTPPRLRVMLVNNGNVVTLQLEEGVAASQLEANRCLPLVEQAAVAQQQARR